MREVDDDEEECEAEEELLREVEPPLEVVAELLLREVDDDEEEDVADLTSPER